MIEFVPPEITTAIAKFLSEGRTGNITLNIKAEVVQPRCKENLS